jgi:cysteinyl-tRNA synthetase
MHNGFLMTEGRRCRSRLGNIFLLREVLDRYGDEVHSDAPVVMMYFLTTHYRSPLEFSVERLDEARASYERLADAVRDIASVFRRQTTRARVSARSSPRVRRPRGMRSPRLWTMT